MRNLDKRLLLTNSANTRAYTALMKIWQWKRSFCRMLSVKLCCYARIILSLTTQYHCYPSQLRASLMIEAFCCVFLISDRKLIYCALPLLPWRPTSFGTKLMIISMCLSSAVTIHFTRTREIFVYKMPMAMCKKSYD